MKNFVFDFYNTLVDIRTDEHSEQSWQGVVEFLAERGIESDPKRLIELYDECWASHLDELKSTTKYAYPEGDITEVYKRMAAALGGTLTDKDAVLCAKIARKDSIRKFDLFDGTLPLLKTLRRNARLYILSNAQSAFTMDEIEAAGIADLFDGIMLSSDYGCRKPDKEFFDCLFKKYKLKRLDTVMVGDDIESDGKGATAYGLRYVYAGGGAAAHRIEIITLA
ncbi:MAG: HAD family hydrolase [Clostridiales bacterium]|nr:HAD family hydrolase [Clostridiales bacterium]